jgi:8-oxo-dGTP pyrophosphatase MutT (NUDIX family)
MLEFEILARGLYRSDQLAITYDPSLRMPVTPEIQQWMDQTWQEQLVIARELQFAHYDAELFRLISVQARSDGTLALVLGDTTYKEYSTTRFPPFTQTFGYTRQQLGNALAVCSVVETSDGYILYEKRRKTALHSGRFHVIAGFFERTLDYDAAGQPDPFGAMRRELREETGIQASDIRAEYCLGVAYDLTSPHGELYFWTRLAISLAEVRTREPEDDEVQHLLALHATADILRDFILANHGHISATGEPAFLLYGAVMYGEVWFDEIMTRLA